jgi:hypothetical protein
MDDIFCNTKYLLFKHCCYCFVQWTIYHLSFCRKVKRQYKHNLSCTMQQLPTSIPTDSSPSAFHREFKNNYLKCHNHRCLYRRNNVHRHFTESSKIITWNATITDVQTDRCTSVGKLSAGQCYWQNYRRTVWIPKGGDLNASLTAPACRWNYRQTTKNMEGD